MTLSIADVSALVAIASAMLVGMFWMLRGRLGGEFVSHVQHQDLADRVGDIETKLLRVATHDDFRQFNDRLSSLAQEVAVMRERGEGVRESLLRIERQLSLFIQAQLEKEQGR